MRLVTKELLAREAGERVTDLRGEDVRPGHGEVVASNGLLHQWLLDALNQPRG